MHSPRPTPPTTMRGRFRSARSCRSFTSKGRRGGVPVYYSHSTVDDRYILYQSPIQLYASLNPLWVWVLPVWIDGHPPVRDVGLVGR